MAQPFYGGPGGPQSPAQRELFVAAYETIREMLKFLRPGYMGGMGAPQVLTLTRHSWTLDQHWMHLHDNESESESLL